MRTKRVKPRPAAPHRVGSERPASRAPETGDALSVTATKSKNRFGPLLETVIKGRSVVITKHDAPKAVLMSIAEYEALSRPSRSTLNTLADEFDTLLARMQTAKSRRAMKAAFGASSRELGALAVAHARRRG